VYAQTFEIAARHRENPNQIVSVADFELVERGVVEARAVLEDPHASLYCVDPKGRRALFVATPREVDLHHAAFLYQAQHRHATRAWSLSYDDFIQAASDRGALRDNVVFLYSVGRCGSTLLSRAFHSFDEVLSLSEPDALTQLLGAGDDPEVATLLESAVRLLCKPGGRKRASHYVIKLRAQGTKLVMPLHRLFPSSRAIFLYRNAVDVVASFVRAFHPLPATVHGYHEDPVRFLTRFWQSNLRHYLAAHERGIPIRAFRYEDLVREPRAAFREIVRWCGTPHTGIEEAFRAFAEDSQEGSNLARKNLDARPALELGSRDELTARVRGILADDPIINDPDLVLANTWTPDNPICL